MMINFEKIVAEFEGPEEKELNMLEVSCCSDRNKGNDRRNMIAFEDQ
ncbi:hypothetical protein AB6D60_25800 [Vibrio splendidus]